MCDDDVIEGGGSSSKTGKEEKSEIKTRIFQNNRLNPLFYAREKYENWSRDGGSCIASKMLGKNLPNGIIVAREPRLNLNAVAILSFLSLLEPFVYACKSKFGGVALTGKK